MNIINNHTGLNEVMMILIVHRYETLKFQCKYSDILDKRILLEFLTLNRN